MRGIAVSIIASLVCVFIHFILAYFRITKVEHVHPIRKLIYHGKVLLLIWIAVLPIFFILFYSAKEIETGAFFNFIYGIAFFWMLFFIYLVFYYIADRSVSSKIMLEIESSPDKRMEFGWLMKVYDADTKYANELRGMQEGCFIIEENGYYSNTLKGALVAKIAGAYKKLFRLGKGG